MFSFLHDWWHPNGTGWVERGGGWWGRLVWWWHVWEERNGGKTWKSAKGNNNEGSIAGQLATSIYAQQQFLQIEIVDDSQAGTFWLYFVQRLEKCHKGILTAISKGIGSWCSKLPVVLRQTTGSRHNTINNCGFLDWGPDTQDPSTTRWHQLQPGYMPQHIARW